MDFLDGLSRDRYAVEFLAASGVTGVVSTRSDTSQIGARIGIDDGSANVRH